MSIFFMDVNWTGIVSSRHVRDTKTVPRTSKQRHLESDFNCCHVASPARAALQVMSWQLETQMLESCT